MDKKKERAIIEYYQQFDEDVDSLEDCLELAGFMADDFKKILAKSVDLPTSSSSC